MLLAVRSWDGAVRIGVVEIGAGDRIRTGDIDLGKVALYQLSYSRLKRNFHFLRPLVSCQTFIVTGELMRARPGFPGE